MEHKQHITYSFNNNNVHQTKWSRWWADNFTSKWFLTKICTGCKSIRCNFDNAEFRINIKILCKQILLWQYFLCFLAIWGTCCISKKTYYYSSMYPIHFQIHAKTKMSKVDQEVTELQLLPWSSSGPQVRTMILHGLVRLSIQPY